MERITKIAATIIFMLRTFAEYVAFSAVILDGRADVVAIVKIGFNGEHTECDLISVRNHLFRCYLVRTKGKSRPVCVGLSQFEAIAFMLRATSARCCHFS